VDSMSGGSGDVHKLAAELDHVLLVVTFEGDFNGTVCRGGDDELIFEEVSHGPPIF